MMCPLVPFLCTNYMEFQLWYPTHSMDLTQDLHFRKEPSQIPCNITKMHTNWGQKIYISGISILNLCNSGIFWIFIQLGSFLFPRVHLEGTINRSIFCLDSETLRTSTIQTVHASPKNAPRSTKICVRLWINMCARLLYGTVVTQSGNFHNKESTWCRYDSHYKLQKSTLTLSSLRRFWAP